MDSKAKCSICSKKIGLLAFTCDCGKKCCSIHRYPEAHYCSIDISNNINICLPKIIPNKINKI